MSLEENKKLLEASALAWMFPIALGLGFGWGWMMDKWLGTGPWFTWAFTILGLIAAFRNLYKLATSSEFDAIDKAAGDESRIIGQARERQASETRNQSGNSKPPGSGEEWSTGEGSGTASDTPGPEL